MTQTFVLPTGSKLRTTKGQRFLLVHEHTPATVWSKKANDGYGAFVPNVKPVVRVLRGSGDRAVAMKSKRFWDRSVHRHFMIDQMTREITEV